MRILLNSVINLPYRTNGELRVHTYLKDHTDMLSIGASMLKVVFQLHTVFLSVRTTGYLLQEHNLIIGCICVV